MGITISNFASTANLLFNTFEEILRICLHLIFTIILRHWGGSDGLNIHSFWNTGIHVTYVYIVNTMASVALAIAWSPSTFHQTISSRCKRSIGFCKIYHIYRIYRCISIYRPIYKCFIQIPRPDSDSMECVDKTNQVSICWTFSS